MQFRGQEISALTDRALREACDEMQHSLDGFNLRAGQFQKKEGSPKVQPTAPGKSFTDLHAALQAEKGKRGL